MRLVGVLNAAVWFGGAVFFATTVAPAFFSEEMGRLLPLAYAGAAIQVVVARFFILQYWCGGIALVHLVAEWLYLGRPLQRFAFGLALGILALSLVGGVWIQPKIRTLHTIKYARGSTQEQRDAAGASLRTWHALSESLFALATLGMLIHLGRIASASNAPRFISATKFRS